MSFDNDFWLNPVGIRKQAEAFDHCAGYAEKAAIWVRANPISLDSGHEAYNHGATAAREISTGLDDFFDRLDTTLRGIAIELREVAREGELIDIEEAARNDARTPTEYNDFDPDAPGGSAAGEIAPEEHQSDEAGVWWQLNGGGVAYYLDAGPQFDYITERQTNLLPGDLLSPSEWITTVLGWFGASDVKDRIFEMFGGPWVDLFKFSFMLRGLGKLLAEMQDLTIAGAAGALSVDWQGFAANSAQEYFQLLQDRIVAAGMRLRSAADAFDQYLKGVDEAMAAIAGAIHSAMDAVIAIVAALVFAGATAETVVGPIAGGLVAGGSMLWAWHKFTEVYGILQDMKSIHEILVAIGNLSADLSDFTDDIQIPAMERT